MSKLFGHGDLRLWLLKLIDDHPRHGYDIIAGLEEQFMGFYSPSPGTVYPRLAALESEGLIEQVESEEGRKVYRLTDKGREELAARSEELVELKDRLTRSAREIARDIRDEVKSAVRDLRSEVKRAAVEVRKDERRAARVTRETAREAARAGRDAARAAREGARAGRDVARVARDAARDASTDIRSAWRSLQADLESFVSDVVSAARRHDLDRERLADLRTALREARASILEALEGRRP